MKNQTEGTIAYILKLSSKTKVENGVSTNESTRKKLHFMDGV